MTDIFYQGAKVRRLTIPAGQATPSAADGTRLDMAATAASNVRYLTVQTGAPSTTWITPLVYDDTAVTGGLYSWTGTTYTKIAVLVA